MKRESTIFLKRIFFIIFLFAMAGELMAGAVLWESGLSLYVKIDNQDKGAKQPNNHPVTLDAETIDSSLRLLKIWDKSFYEEGDAERVFSVDQTRLLGKHISEGLKLAKTNEDIIFALASMKKGTLGTREPKFMGGRAFFLNNELNIIIGDYDKPRDKGMEAAVGGSGLTEIKYYIKIGKRNKASKFKKNMIQVDGINRVKIDSKIRKDWFTLNLDKTKIVALNQRELRRRGTKEYKQEKLFKDEAAKLAKERREMRLEMARLRKEMEGNNGSVNESVEDRLKKLKELINKDLISKEEYDKKRTEILNDI